MAVSLASPSGLCNELLGSVGAGRVNQAACKAGGSGAASSLTESADAELDATWLVTVR